MASRYPCYVRAQLWRQTRFRMWATRRLTLPDRARALALRRGGGGWSLFGYASQRTLTTFGTCRNAPLRRSARVATHPYDVRHVSQRTHTIVGLLRGAARRLMRTKVLDGITF